MTDKCAVCGQPGDPCYATFLCDTHAVEANRARDAAFGMAPWPQVVKFVAEWVRQQCLRKPENEVRT